MTSGNEDETARLDLNNPVFQQALFNLQKNEQRNIPNTLKKWRPLPGHRFIRIAV